jgi:predicted  nucleic acid-binding Zn-ribbon protein
MQSLRAEIDSLSLQLASISSDLTQSQAELQALKIRLVERETAYRALEQSLTQSTQSLKTYASQLQSANLKLAISILANVVLTGGIIYFILH